MGHDVGVKNYQLRSHAGGRDCQVKCGSCGEIWIEWISKGTSTQTALKTFKCPTCNQSKAEL